MLTRAVRRECAIVDVDFVEEDDARIRRCAAHVELTAAALGLTRGPRIDNHRPLERVEVLGLDHELDRDDMH
jgi:hypothetical protein